MNAMKNLVHGVILAVWALLGLVFSLKVVFGDGPSLTGLFTAGAFWLWFAAFAALTTWALVRFQKPIAPLLVHSGAVILLCMIPKVAPFHLLRLGIDLLGIA